MMRAGPFVMTGPLKKTHDWLQLLTLPTVVHSEVPRRADDR